MNDLPLSVKRRLVTEHGIRHVVALCPRQDPDLWTLDDEGLIAYSHYPMPDGAKIPAWLPGVAAQLGLAIQRGDGVLVHCFAGRNRAALVAGAVVHEVEGTSGPDLVALIRQARPNALANPAFEDYLEHL